jgi:hypothetical protein
MQPIQPLPRVYLRTSLADRLVRLSSQKNLKMENPPLWVWAIVVGLIIAGKFAYRWKTTKQLAKEMEQNEKVIDSSKAMQDSKNKNNNNNNNTGSISNIRTTMSHKYSRHKYSPSSLRNYFEIRKRKL